MTWTQPAPLGDDPDQIVIGDSRKAIYRLRVGDQLRELAQTKLDEKLLGPTAGLNNTLIASTSGPAADFLVGFEMIGLKESFKTLLGGRITWGPLVAGDVCLLQTDDSVLRAFDAAGKQKFELKLPAGSPVGNPLIIDDKIVLCGRPGWIVSIDSGAGVMLGSDDIGQPISATPLGVSGQLLVPGSEGVVYLVQVPANG